MASGGKLYSPILSSPVGKTKVIIGRHVDGGWTNRVRRRLLGLNEGNQGISRIRENFPAEKSVV